MSTIMILSIKVAALFVHGPEMKKLSTRMTSLESQCESSLQLMLVLAISLSTGRFNWVSLSSFLSSVLMIGKSGAESYLTFGNDNLIELAVGGLQGLLRKLKLLAIYSPMFVATTASRLTALAVMFTWDTAAMGIVLLPLSLAAPTLLLLLTKLCKLKDLSVLDLVKAVLGEQTTHSLWGKRGRERGRRLQLFMQIYLLLVHSALMSLVLMDVQVIYGPRVPTATLVRCQTGAGVSLAIGWL